MTTGRMVEHWPKCLVIGILSSLSSFSEPTLSFLVESHKQHFVLMREMDDLWGSVVSKRCAIVIVGSVCVSQIRKQGHSFTIRVMTPVASSVLTTP